MESFILIDSHVHLVSAFSVKKFFYYAIKNFVNESKKLGVEKFIGVLFLTETKKDNYFSKLILN